MAVPRTDPVARAAESYWAQSRQPLASLIFLAPLLVIYEVGVLVLGPEPDKVRNGVDALLRQILGALGFGQYFLLPLLIVGILLGWHYTTRGPWRLTSHVLYGMAAESVLLAIVLRLVLQMQKVAFDSLKMAITLDVSAGPHPLRDALRTAVSYLGAGVYEELLFRLILLSLVAMAFRRFERTRKANMILAALVTSLLFAVAHYVGPYGDKLQWFSFLFRFLAGLFFAVLFVYRGFGIAAGAHACYDLLVGLL